MMSDDSTEVPSEEHQPRSLGFWQATAINLTQIVGSGVFVTIPLILGVLPGAYALLGWLVAGVLILADCAIWGELGAAMPAAGGTYHFLLESYGRARWGRIAAFLFVWQILISGPLEIGSGLVAAAQFSTAIDPGFKDFDERHTQEWSPITLEGTAVGISIGPSRLFGIALGAAVLFLLYRRVETLGRLSVIFAVGVLGLIAWVLIEGALRFDPALAFDFSLQGDEKPPDLESLGVAMGFAIYAYFGYYSICYLGGEVRNPAKTIPRSIVASALLAIVLFSALHLAIVGVLPWRELLMPAIKDNPTAEFMARVRGQWAAAAVALCLLGSCFASVFAGMLGYSRVPFAAAREGHFFRWFGELHPRTRIPHRALILFGISVLICSFFNLDAIIKALVATRILEQFVAQIFGLISFRHRNGASALPWRMWLYPLPCAVALIGWLYVYLTIGLLYISIGACTLVVGASVFLIWAKYRGDWPFTHRAGAGRSTSLNP